MGRRKQNAPRRGSLAFIPRGRTSAIVPIVRTWPKSSAKEPALLGSAGFKAGSTHVLTVDDRSRTPNFGKPRFSSATILVTPPLQIIGFRAYRKDGGGLKAVKDVVMRNPPKGLSRKLKLKSNPTDDSLKMIEAQVDKLSRFTVLAMITPRNGGLAQKKPFLFEIGLGGGDIRAQYEYAKSALGTEMKASSIFEAGSFVDVHAVSKGKGFEGVISRMGVKRKSHKSNKTVREVASIGPWHPPNVMYTVPRAGQKGVHQRTEYNKRIISFGNAAEAPITPKGGLLHFGDIKGEYLLLEGSVPGPPKGLVRLRTPIRPVKMKGEAPKILEVASVR